MENAVRNLKTNINHCFQESILKPRIAVKSFAKVSCLEKSEKHNISIVPEKTQRSLLTNLEVVINAVARGENIEVSDNFQESESVGVEYFKMEVTSDSQVMLIPILNKDLNTLTKIPVTPNNLLNETALPSPLEHFEQASSKSPDQGINESILCDVCNETFINGILYSFHSIKHDDNNKYSCHVCKYRTISKKKIEKHAAAHERKTIYNCEICNKGFTRQSDAAAHKNVHTGDKPFLCDICGTGSASKSMFWDHRRYHHWKVLGLSPSKYDCKYCGKRFLSFTTRARHINREHEYGLDGSELCDICGKRLTSKQGLLFHKRTHTGYKPFACNICEKRFPRMLHLTIHMRVHSGEKPHKCKHCNKCFTQRSPLKIHERIHTGERPYICQLCNKGFISRGSLNLHVKRCQEV